MTSSCDAPHLNPALLRRLSWLCTGACLALVAYAFTDVRRNTASLGGVLIEQAASRREYALVDERDTLDYPREVREGYEEPRLHDERYGDDVVYEAPRGQEFVAARDSEELERGTADEATVAQPSNAWFTTLVSSGKSQVDRVHAALHDLYQAATGQEPLISERQGHHDALLLASYVNGEEVSPAAEPAAASHDSETAAASDSIPTAAASDDSEITASDDSEIAASDDSEIAVKSEGIQTAATPHHSETAAASDDSETAAASDDSETLQELAKQVDEMTEQAEANQQSIQADAQGVLSSDGEDDVNSLAARLNGVEETNVENQQAVGSALTTPNSKSEKH